MKILATECFAHLSTSNAAKSQGMHNFVAAIVRITQFHIYTFD